MPGTGAFGDRCAWALGDLTYGAHSAQGLHACPFDLPSTPATRATPRSEVGRDAKVVPSNERRDGPHHSLPGARRALRGSAEVGPMLVRHGEKPDSAATSPGAHWRAPGTADGVSDVYGRAEPRPPPEKGAQCSSCLLHPRLLGLARPGTRGRTIADLDRAPRRPRRADRLEP